MHRTLVSMKNRWKWQLQVRQAAICMYLFVHKPAGLNLCSRIGAERTAAPISSVHVKPAVDTLYYQPCVQYGEACHLCRHRLVLSGSMYRFFFECNEFADKRLQVIFLAIQLLILLWKAKTQRSICSVHLHEQPSSSVIKNGVLMWQRRSKQSDYLVGPS